MKNGFGFGISFSNIINKSNLRYNQLTNHNNIHNKLNKIIFDLLIILW